VNVLLVIGNVLAVRSDHALALVRVGHALRRIGELDRRHFRRVALEVSDDRLAFVNFAVPKSIFFADLDSQFAEPHVVFETASDPDCARVIFVCEFIR